MLDSIKQFAAPLRDPRYFQIVFLSTFLLFGVYSLGWKANWTMYLVTIATSLGTQIVLEKWYKRPKSSIKSALITSLGLCLLLKSDAHWVMALAAFAAIGGKFWFRYNGKHLFNPANFGIIATILLTNQAWISPGQWGSAPVLTFFFLGAGLMILLKISRLETAITFLAVFGLLLISRMVWYQGWEYGVVFHKLTNGSLLLFTFFMITDPMTIPNGSKARIIWAALLAIISFVATSWFFLHTAAIWVLFLFTPLTVVLDQVLKSKKYEWPEIKIRRSSQPSLEKK
ncbi:MAG: Na+-transporting NADH:ubiquinone oxidoreductase subunit NqrB [Bacteroidia bacterium]|jgi:Na+-transporting NADH:ubiquinone oxidoreductase subunit NqrB